MPNSVILIEKDTYVIEQRSNYYGSEENVLKIGCM